MKILIACEESQAVCKAFRAKGHEAYSCDTLPCSGGHPEWHIQDDVLKYIGAKEKDTHYGWIKPQQQIKWDMIIAHPPCTHLAVSGARHFKEKIADGRQQEGIDFFMKFTKVSCPRVMIENPIGIMSSIYKKPDQIIQPFEFGDPVKKSTCLWLKGLPKLKETNNVSDKVSYYVDKKGVKQSEWNVRQLVINGKKYGYNTEQFKQHRSKTFQGIADAMADQWG